MRDRRATIEFALIVVLMTMLGAIARSALPDVHRLLRFLVVVAVTIPVWLAARLVLRRWE